MSSHAAEHSIGAFTAWSSACYRLRKKLAILLSMRENMKNLLEMISI